EIFTGQRTEQLTATEQLHLQALEIWANGNVVAACDLWDQILVAEPRDLLALKMQHFNLFWLGQSQHMHDAAVRARAAYSEETPGYANVLGIHAFALEELNRYAEAEAAGREAVERHAEDLWGVHAVAHVLEMQGRTQEGVAWLDGPMDRWDDRNPFRCHLWWHAAMFRVERGEFEAALELFDTAILPNDTLFYLDIQNTASLLARLEFIGVDVGDRWEQLVEAAESRIGDYPQIFTQPHCAMVFGRTGRAQKTAEQIEALQPYAEDPDNSSGTLVRALVAPICHAIRDYHAGRFESAADTLHPLRYHFQPIGGSHAQRDIFQQYLINSHYRAGRLTQTRALLDERIARYPNSFGTWKRYAEVCRELGDTNAEVRAQLEMQRVTA
ncbi:MAG: tetratricopeptide repeat protein, partial [Pseudomonadota bacterium]